MLLPKISRAIVGVCLVGVALGISTDLLAQESEVPQTADTTSDGSDSQSTSPSQEPTEGQDEQSDQPPSAADESMPEKDENTGATRVDPDSRNARLDIQRGFEESRSEQPLAGEAPQSPEDLAIFFQSSTSTTTERDRREDWDLLQRFCRQADRVFVGKVLGTTYDPKDHSKRVTFQVEDMLRGEPETLIEVRLADSQVEDGEQEVEATVVRGYRMLVFIDEFGQVLDGRSMMFVEGGYAWRNRREDVFLRPRADRDWIYQIDPSEDYASYALTMVKEEVQAPRGLFRKRRRFR